MISASSGGGPPDQVLFAKFRLTTRNAASAFRFCDPRDASMLFRDCNKLDAVEKPDSYSYEGGVASTHF